MINVGQQLPKFKMKATVSTELNEAFQVINDDMFRSKWLVLFFWPKDFTFVCPTEIAEFGKLHSEFAERDAQILGASTYSEFVHLAWRNQHPDLKELPFPLV